MMECRVIKNASTQGNICGKVVGASGEASGERGPVSQVDCSDDSSNIEDAISPKKIGPN